MSTKPQRNNEQLSEEDRAVFERLKDAYEDDEEMQRICELVLQDSSSEEANS